MVPLLGPKGSVQKVLFNYWTLQWKGLNLYSRGRALKIATFEGSGYLGLTICRRVFFNNAGTLKIVTVFEGDCDESAVTRVSVSPNSGPPAWGPVVK